MLRLNQHIPAVLQQQPPLLPLPFYGPLSGTTRVSDTRKNIQPFTPILIINHPLSASSIYYDP